MKYATRQAFAPYGWFGAFDNCLWDIAGKAAGMPVCSLMGRVRDRAPAYYNIRGDSMDKAVEDSEMAVGMGFPALKDHFVQEPGDNIEWFRAVRDAVGPDVDLMHDPVGMYTFGEAVRIGRALEEVDFRWLEEPMNDVRRHELRALCDTLDIPVLNPESLTNAIDLSAEWLISGAAGPAAGQRQARRHIRAEARPPGRVARHERRDARRGRPLRPLTHPPELRHRQHQLLRVLPRWYP